MAFSYGGKPAADVTIRSAQLPMPATHPPSKRSTKSSQPSFAATRLETNRRTATLYGQEIAWFRHRLERLQLIVTLHNQRLEPFDRMGNQKHYDIVYRFHLLAYFDAQAKLETCRHRLADLTWQADRFIKGANRPGRDQEELSGIVIATANAGPPLRRPSRDHGIQMRRPANPLPHVQAVFDRVDRLKLENADAYAIWADAPYADDAEQHRICLARIGDQLEKALQDELCCLEFIE